MSDAGAPVPSQGRDPGPGRDLRAIRAWSGPVFFGLATAVLLGALKAGIVPRAPVVVASLLLVASLLWSGLRWLRARLDRWFWLIRWKLAASYMIIAFVPLLLVTGMLFLLGYLATGQFLAMLASHRLAEIAADVDEVATAIAERTEAIRQEPDLAKARKLALAFDGGAELRWLQRRYQPGEEGVSGKGAVSALVIGPGDKDSAGLDFPNLQVPGAEGKPGQRTWHENGAEGQLAVRARKGLFEVLEVRAARVPAGPGRKIYVEVAVALSADVLRSVRTPLGLELQVIRPLAGGASYETVPTSGAVGAGGSLGLGGLPILGIASLDFADWDAETRRLEERLLVVQRSASGLVSELWTFGQDNRGLFYFVLFVTIAALLLAEALSLALGLQLARSITGSLQAIIDGTSRVERGDFGHRIPVTSRDQLGSLTQSFNRMTESVENLVTESAERERLEEELRIGRRIQQSLLPRADFRDERFEIAGMSLPAKEVGGDYFDLFDLGSGRLALLVADVSGKGTEAAFYMAEVKGIMLSLSRSHGRPLDVLREANALLGTSLDRRTFVTMTYGVLDRESRIFCFARAGHNPILHLPAGEGCACSHRPAGLALGLDRSGRFGHILEERSITLEPGALLLLYTDGATDTMSETGELYGEERLAHALEGARGKSAEAVRDGIAAELRRFAAIGPPHDDLTIIVVRTL